MNILTFDIEEWVIESIYRGGRIRKYEEFDSYLRLILDKLDELQIKATFFCLGRMAVDFPDVVKTIANHGHEIGCHSNKHVWLTKLTLDELLDDTRQAVDALEQCIGRKIVSYRAPAFSIGENNKWAFEILAECGIKRDASIFPAVRDFGGFRTFGCNVPVCLSYRDIVLHEFPVVTMPFCGKEIAYSGGGYFRFFPLKFVKNKIKNSDYAMVYFHIGDLIPETKGMLSRQEYETYFKESGTLFNRYERYLKGNIGTKNAFHKMIDLLETVKFVNVEEADKEIDWQSVPTVIL